MSKKSRYQRYLDEKENNSGSGSASGSGSGQSMSRYQRYKLYGDEGLKTQSQAMQEQKTQAEAKKAVDMKQAFNNFNVSKTDFGRATDQIMKQGNVVAGMPVSKEYNGKSQFSAQPQQVVNQAVKPINNNIDDNSGVKLDYKDIIKNSSIGKAGNKPQPKSVLDNDYRMDWEKKLADVTNEKVVDPVGNVIQKGIINPIKKGQLQYDQSKEYYQEMQENITGKILPKTANPEKYSKKIANDYAMQQDYFAEAGNKWKQDGVKAVPSMAGDMVQAVLEQLTMWVNNMAHGGALGAGAGAGTGAIMGAGAGPVGAGAGAIAGAGTGFKIGTTVDMAQQMAGDVYGTLTRDLGIDKGVATAISIPAGAIMGAIEHLQVWRSRRGWRPSYPDGRS